MSDHEIEDSRGEGNDQPNEDIESIVPHLPAENARWYSRLVEYLRLGAGRSVRAVYNREKGNERSKSVPASWSQAAHRYEWQRRAEAYDAHRRSAVFKAGNASDVERVKKLDEVIEQLHQRVTDMLKNALPELQFNDRLIAQYLAAIDLLAKHTGGYAAQRIEHTGKDGKAIEVEGGITQQVIFYMPEVDELPEISNAPGDGAAHTVDGTIEAQEGST